MYTSYWLPNNQFSHLIKKCIQIDGVATGFPLAPILTNIFLWHHEENWLDICHIEFKPNFYRMYVDDIFVFFKSPQSSHSFRYYMSYKHQDIIFNVEHEDISSLLFLDVKTCRKNGQFVTSVYRKPIFSGFLTNYKSFHSNVPKKRSFIQITS